MTRQTEEFYRRLDHEDRQKVHDALAQTTLKHIGAAPNLFRQRSFDLAANPSQHLEVVHLEPNPIPNEDAQGLANIAGGEYFRFLLEQAERDRALIGLQATYQEDTRKPLFSVSTHQSIIDIILLQTAQGLQKEDELWQAGTALTISRGVTTIEAFGMAASEVTTKGGHSFLVFPRSKTILEAGVDPDLIELNNRRARIAILHWIGYNALGIRTSINPGPKHHFSAWEGATTKVTRDENGKLIGIELGRVADGVLSYMKHGITQPYVLWRGDCPDGFVYVAGEPTTVKSTEDIARVQKWQKDVLAERLGLSDDAVLMPKAA